KVSASFTFSVHANVKVGRRRAGTRNATLRVSAATKEDGDRRTGRATRLASQRRACNALAGLTIRQRVTLMTRNGIPSRARGHSGASARIRGCSRKLMRESSGCKRALVNLEAG